ncbi:putative uncharacterized protein [Microcella alkaliphila]|uniref:Uncharacterized protein n=1 Tax=Microcella alkaliphila TaxID=279828 RepID=A0A0U5BN97_9MICO|nr:putative uncharacterized protein [Microcella alkaliphila]
MTESFNLLFVRVDEVVERAQNLRDAPLLVETRQSHRKPEEVLAGQAEVRGSCRVSPAVLAVPGRAKKPIQVVPVHTIAHDIEPHGVLRQPAGPFVEGQPGNAPEQVGGLCHVLQ